MKKLFLIFLVLLLAMTSQVAFAAEVIDTDGDQIDDGTDSYDYAVTNSDYDRIEKIDGIWYGIINVTETWIGPRTTGQNFNTFYLQFTRDLQELVSVSYDYVLSDYCSGYELFGACLTGEVVNNETGSIIAYNKYEDGSFLDRLTTSDEIGTSTNVDVEMVNSTFGKNFDTSIDTFYFIRTPFNEELKSVTVVEFSYILTEQELIDLRLDIQEQFDNEAETILENDLLTQEEQDLLMQDLIAQYEQYEIDTDEVLTSTCEGDQCTDVNEDATDSQTLDDIIANSIIQKIQNFIIKFSLAVAGIIGIGIAAYLTAIYITKSAFKTTGFIGLGSLKIIKKSGGFWGNALFNGTVTFIKSIGKGLKAIFSNTKK